MGTEPARLQKRLEAALGPAWGVERKVRLAATLQHHHVAQTPTEIGTALGTPACMVLEQVTGHPTMVHCADQYALGAMACELLVGSHPFAGRAPPPRSRFGRDAGASPDGPAAIVMSALASTLPATHLMRTLAPRDSGRSTPEVVFPPPTGGRFK